jgi:hypothetical protein
MVQFKTVHRILVTNHNLHKWKITERDTITHFLYDCNQTFDLWQSIMKWTDGTFDLYIPLTSHEIIFGIPNENEEQIIEFYNCMIYNYKKTYLNLDL